MPNTTPVIMPLTTPVLNPNATSNRLERNIHEIMNQWEERALEEIKAAYHLETLSLRDSLPEYLVQLVKALSDTIDRTAVRKRHDKAESTRVGKKHGKERAGSFNYTMDQMILEYHILRQVVCDVLENEAPLSALEREVIVCSVEQAVNDAATEFSDTLKDLQEQLSYTLAHDIRNPLTIARASAELILKRHDPKDHSAVNAERIVTSVDRIDQMITDLLDASRIRAGLGLALEFKMCDLNLTVKDIAQELNIVHPGRFVTNSPEKCVGLWNENGLRRLIENLATNAIKYGDDNAPITISVAQIKDGSVLLKVNNLGKPIPLDELSILFQKFKRSKSAEDKVGWGLGLTVVKGMVDAHKGSIVVESAEGEGTTFIIKLPKDSLNGFNSRNNIH